MIWTDCDWPGSGFPGVCVDAIVSQFKFHVGFGGICAISVGLTGRYFKTNTSRIYWVGYIAAQGVSTGDIALTEIRLELEILNALA